MHEHGAMEYERKTVEEIEGAILRGPRLLQVIVGPRQVGKTMVAEAVCRRLGRPVIFEAADTALPPGPEWIETNWARARALSIRPALLVLDEVQNVRGWGETVKRLWDEDRRIGETGIDVLLLGSSALQIHRGTSESLAGRFSLHRCMHWDFSECAQAFGWTLDQWLFYGGYPGAAPFVPDTRRWARYVADSLIETAIARDVLQMQTVHKPALLRTLFGLAASHPAQIHSFNKMLGQLVDAGNTTTLAHYLDLLETAFLVSGLQLFSAGNPRRRASSPKIILWNNALVNAFMGRSPAEASRDGAWWGRIVENAVGAHLLNGLPRESFQIHYWRDGAQEVDFVVSRGNKVWALEVKSGRPAKTPGLTAFRRKFLNSQSLLIGPTGIPLQDFFSRPPETWFGG